MTTHLPDRCETLIIGAGVVGLSLAYELATRGIGVTVIDRQPPGLEASWAGAGILPPGSWYDDRPPLVALAALSAPLNVEWTRQLLKKTNIDNELARVGAVHIAETPEQAARLQVKFDRWQALGIEAYELDDQQQRSLSWWSRTPSAARLFHVPGESVINNRFHLQALADGCRQLGVKIIYPAEVTRIERRGNAIDTVVTTVGQTSPRQIVLAAGAWSGTISEVLGWRLPIRPMRGQMLEFESTRPNPFDTIVHCGDCYIVPRRDGRLIVGSTVEDVGFDKQTTKAELSKLEDFARQLTPALCETTIRDAWSGLRPASGDGLPYIGRAPGVHNMYVSTGHFRAGLQLASGSAVLLANLITGLPTPVDLEPFRVER